MKHYNEFLERRLYNTTVTFSEDRLQNRAGAELRLPEQLKCRLLAS